MTKRADLFKASCPGYLWGISEVEPTANVPLEPASMIRKPIGPNLVVADQPTAEELEALRAEGFVAVVNLRHDGEPEQPLSTAEEGEAVRALGMAYLHEGVGALPFPESTVQTVATFLDTHANDKVLVHCRKGGRAAALVLLHHAQAEGWKPAEAIAKGRALGLEVDGKLREAVEAYLAEYPTEA